MTVTLHERDHATFPGNLRVRLIAGDPAYVVSRHGSSTTIHTYNAGIFELTPYEKRSQV